jgi:hypothetical protein
MGGKAGKAWALARFREIENVGGRSGVPVKCHHYGCFACQKFTVVAL